MKVTEAQKDLIGVLGHNEEYVLKSLQKIYKQALKEVDNKLAALMGRTDLENLQSIIYQKQYQNAIKEQLSGILDAMNGQQYKTISDYLQCCYTDSYIGTMRDLAQQGIPLIVPIQQADVIKAVTLNSKLSKGLYDSLGEDVNKLKRTVATELTRGIATGGSYDTVAQAIARKMIGGASDGGNLYRAQRIARTEGHRVQSEAQFDALHAAKKRGADVVKQWRANLDAQTRDSHAHLDGEIHEIDDIFSNGLQFPGEHNGPAAEVINCRCRCAQRAKWALDDEELEELQKRAEYFGIDKSQSFEEFKANYIKADPVEVAKAEAPAGKIEKEEASVKLDIANYPKEFTAKKAEAQNTQKVVDFVNNVEGVDTEVMQLYNQMGGVVTYTEQGIPFSISHASDHRVGYRAKVFTDEIVDVQIVIPKISGENIAGQVATTLHEEAHLIDLALKDNPKKRGEYCSASNAGLRQIFSKVDHTVGGEVKTLFDKFNAECAAIETRQRGIYDEAVNAARATYLPNGVWGAGSDYRAYEKAVKAARKALIENIDYEQRNALGGGVSGLQDIYDALSAGEARESHVVLYGHGMQYYSGIDNRIEETLANYCALSVTRPDLIEMLEADKPELVKAMRNNITAMLERAAKIAK